jgi:hypothetical protein
MILNSSPGLIRKLKATTARLGLLGSSLGWQDSLESQGCHSRECTSFNGLDWRETGEERFGGRVRGLSGLSSLSSRSRGAATRGHARAWSRIRGQTAAGWITTIGRKASLYPEGGIMTGAFLHCYLTPVESSEIQCRETPSISLDCTPPPFVASTSIAPRAGLFVTQDTVINHIETIPVPPLHSGTTG